MKYISILTTFMMSSTILGLLLFFRGVFIDRRYLREKSIGNYDKKKPVVFLVIDSFRADLAVSEHFSFIQQHKSSNQSLFFLSIADAPTVTGPRIQTLTTGNFAPLTKVLDNFHDSEVVEDNILDQAKQHKIQTLLIGDNNWLGLYPHSFTYAYPLHDMHVNDDKMYKVDKKFKEIILHNLESGFDLIVVHFLGLDFVAHEYNRVLKNKMLEEQLQQLSDIITEIYQAISNETTLIITGDHGMLNDGNHGGYSNEETNTVFFATKKSGEYNCKHMENIHHNEGKNFLINKEEYLRDVKQIDITPTLAKLLGLPIPFSNIGILIPEVFPENEVHQYCMDNLNQMVKYVERIHQVQGFFSSSQIYQWKQQIPTINNCQKAIPLMKDIQYHSRLIWNQYNEPLIILSIIYQSLTLILYIVCLLSICKIQDDDFDFKSIIQPFQDIKNVKYRNLGVFITLLSIIIACLLTDIENVLTTFLIILTIGLLYISIKKLIHIYKEENTYLSINSSLHNNHQFRYVYIFLLVIFISKVFRQASLIFSLNSFSIEQTDLFDQFLNIIVIALVLNLFIFSKKFLEKELSERQFAKKIALQLIFGLLIYFFLELEYHFYLLSEKHPHKKLKIKQQFVFLYIPSIIQHILLYFYQQRTNSPQIDKFVGHCYLSLMQIYFILPQFHHTSISELQIVIMVLMVYTFYAKDLVFLLIPSMLATSQYGIAIYTVFILLMILIYNLLKNQFQYNYLPFLATISILSQFTWFMIRNKCTISAVQNAASSLGFSTTDIIQTPLILFLLLAGPYFGSCVFLKYFTVLQKNQSKQTKDPTIQIKLLFLFNFYLQIYFTEIHNYRNLGGITSIQFKYIFDVVGYMIISLLTWFY